MGREYGKRMERFRGLNLFRIIVLLRIRFFCFLYFVGCSILGLEELKIVKDLGINYVLKQSKLVIVLFFEIKDDCVYFC